MITTLTKHACIKVGKCARAHLPALLEQEDYIRWNNIWMVKGTEGQKIDMEGETTIIIEKDETADVRKYSPNGYHPKVHLASSYL